MRKSVILVEGKEFVACKQYRSVGDGGPVHGSDAWPRGLGGLRACDGL